MTIVERVQAVIQDLERAGMRVSVRSVRPRVHANNAEVAAALKRLRPELQGIEEPTPPQKERPMVSSHKVDYAALHEAVMALRPLISQLAKDQASAAAISAWFVEHQADEEPPVNSRTFSAVANYVEEHQMLDRQARLQAKMEEAYEALPALLAAGQEALPPLLAELRRRRDAWKEAQRQEREALAACNQMPVMLLQEAQQLLHQAEQLSEAAAVA